jgi:hypothetical protein
MNTIKSAMFTLLAMSFFALPAIAGPPYRGVGGQLEAVGMVAGTYLGTAQYIEACQKFPDVKTRAIKSYREYLERNNQTYMDMMGKLPSLASANGGDAEVKRVKAELAKGFTFIEENAKKEAAQYAQSAAWRSAFLDKVDKGLLDLKLKHSIELTKIMK